MKIEKEIRDDHQVKLTVEIEAELFEQFKHRAARQIARRVKIPGFRPGKAPYGVILRTVGEGQVVEHALELLIDEQYPEIIKQAEINPYGPGTLENVQETDPPKLEFVIPLDAQVELGDYKSIRIPFELPETTEDEFQKAIDRIREQNAGRESVERPAQMGDTVFLRVSGLRTDSENEENETILEERFSSSIIRDEAQQDEFPFPGFSKELIGLSPKDTKIIPYTFPEDDEREELRDKQAEYTVVVSNVQATTLPDLDDEFAKKVSEFNTIEEWKIDLKVNLQKQAESNYTDEYDDQVIDQVIAASNIKYPPQMAENEVNEMIRSLEYRLSQQGITKELYLQIRGMDEEALLEEIKPIAEERLKHALVLFQIAENEKIEIDETRIQNETFRTFNTISSQMTPKEAKKLTKSRFLPNLITNITMDLTTQTTMEFLRATAKGETWSPQKEKEIEGSSKIEAADGVETNDEKLAVESEQAIHSESITPAESEEAENHNPDSRENETSVEAILESESAQLPENNENHEDTAETHEQ